VQSKGPPRGAMSRRQPPRPRAGKPSVTSPRRRARRWADRERRSRNRAKPRLNAEDFGRPSSMITGACLCRGVTWCTDAAPTSVHYCHCTLCRRWTGSPFATLAWFPAASVRWRGQKPIVFRSSPIAVRTHCGRCGTPLSLSYDGRDEVALTVGSFDAPESVKPDHHYGSESRLPWVDTANSLPSRATEEHW
jgi:hypothetical protein